MARRFPSDKTKMRYLRDALRVIRDGIKCEHTWAPTGTNNLGACYRNGRTARAVYSAERCCDACIADRALKGRPV